MYSVIGTQSDSGELSEKDITKVTPAPATYGDLLVKYIAALGVDVVFGVPGGAIEPLMNALARGAKSGGPRLVVSRHESSAAFMADGYYRETGKIGVVCSTTGPGATNLLTGISSAFVEEVPVLVITAQTQLGKFGKGALQDSSCSMIDTVGMFRYVTKFSTLVSHPEQFEAKITSAILAANRLPKGPVHLSFPSDILRMDIERCAEVPKRLLSREFSEFDKQSFDKLGQALERFNNLVFYLGNGLGEAAAHVLEFIERTGAPFITDPVGKRWVDELHPQYRGVYGFAGHANAQTLIQNEKVELIIAVGTALGELETSGWSNAILNDKLIHIDSNPEHFSRSPMAYLHVCGNIEAIFRCLTKRFQHLEKWAEGQNELALFGLDKNIIGGCATFVETEKCLSDKSPIKPQRLMYSIAHSLPDDVRVFIDAGNAWSWATHYFVRKNNRGYYRIAMAFGSMTWSIGASIGSAIANKSPSLCIVGDGSYLMSAQEITVAAQHQLPVVFLILNDSALGMVMHGQKLGGQESIGWELNKIDYAKMARAMGVSALIVKRPSQLDDIDWFELFNRDSPTLIDVQIDRDEVPPMKDRVKSLASRGSMTPGG